MVCWVREIEGKRERGREKERYKEKRRERGGGEREGDR